ncbi:MAG: globin domain-containing protein [Lysobacterales bacterium]
MQIIQRAIVRSSFADMAPKASDLAHAFYEELFALDPGVKPLFNSDPHQQGEKLLQMIGAAIDLLEQPERLNLLLQQLGRRHVGYGVRRGHYRLVGLALARSLERVLGERCTAEVRQAWMRFCRLITQQMIAGAAELQAAA